MFIQPDLIGHGYGRGLWNHAVESAASMSEWMLIMADPGSVGFYEAMGASLERHQEMAPGFSVGVYWYYLTRGGPGPPASRISGTGSTSE